jgi:hypothetical protein
MKLRLEIRLSMTDQLFPTKPILGFQLFIKLSRNVQLQKYAKKTHLSLKLSLNKSYNFLTLNLLHPQSEETGVATI